MHRLVIASFALVTSFFFAANAEAHFVLKTPASFQKQSVLGDPQKAPPCGGTGVATGEVTTYKAGDTISVTLDETVTHPGHYRVAIGKNGPDDLPPEPPVTKGTTDCGSTTIMNPPVFPVLVDGALVHTKAFTGTQTIQLKLPADFTCTNCTLQVLEFMGQHGLNVPGGCFYHHCATITVTGNASTMDAGASGSSGSSSSSSGGATSGGATSSGATSGGTSGASSSSGTGPTETASSSTSSGEAGDGGCSLAGRSGNGFTLGLLALLGVFAYGAARKRPGA
jgi:hypothetical protein